MVKERTQANRAELISHFTKIAAEENVELPDLLAKFLDSLKEETRAESIFIMNSTNKEIIVHDSSSDEQIPPGKSPAGDLIIKDLGQSWKLLVKKPEENDPEFWSFIQNLLSMILRGKESEERTNLILSLSSDIRRTLKPELALEKIYESLKATLNLKEFYFFLETDEMDHYYVSMVEAESPKERLENRQTLVVQDFSDLKFINSELEVLDLECKNRDKFWGHLILAREKPWDKKDASLVKPFAEQMATVFSQHELRSESLSMAQREFLLNQITTSIRESLEVDTILKIATQEIAQVLGVEACGIAIFDQEMSSAVNYQVWSPEEETEKKMTTLIKRTINSEYSPSMSVPIINIPDFSLKKDSLAEFFSKLLGAKSYLSCALRSPDKDEITGMLSVAFFNNKRLWSPEEEQLIESIATQLEMALSQASIYQESQQTKMQMALLHTLSNDIRDSLEISKVLEQTAKGIGEVLGLSRCFVRRLSWDYKILKTEKEFTGEGYFPSSDVLLDFEQDWIEELKEHSLSEIEEKYLSIPYVKAKMVAANSPLIQVADAIDLKSYLCVPLIGRDRVLGTINAHQCDRERNFLAEEVEFVRRVASEAAVAIEHAQLFETIDRMSKTDPDTGLYNKGYFHEIAEEEIRRAARENREISYLMLDLDYLKEINDTPEIGGHQAGDEAIRLVAHAIEKTVRQTPIDEIRTRRADVVGRFGGDEFMVLLPDTALPNAIRVAERIESNIQKTKHSTWNKPLSVSIGVAGTPNDRCEFEHLKQMADKALYLSKERGRGLISSSLDLD